MTKSAATVAGNDQQLTPANITVLKSVLKHSEIKPDFGAVASDIGISLKSNA